MRYFVTRSIAMATITVTACCLLLHLPAASAQVMDPNTASKSAAGIQVPTPQVDLRYHQSPAAPSAQQTPGSSTGTVESATAGMDADLDTTSANARADSAFAASVGEVSQRRAAVTRAKLAYETATPRSAARYSAEAAYHRANAATSASEMSALELAAGWLKHIREAIVSALTAPVEADEQVADALRKAQRACGTQSECRKTLPALYSAFSTLPSRGDSAGAEAGRAALAQIDAASASIADQKREAAFQHAFAVQMAATADYNARVLKTVEELGPIEASVIPGGVTKAYDLSATRK